MHTEIGEATCRMWQYLAERGEATRRQRQRGTTLSARLRHRGVGWLARDDTRGFVQARGVVKLALHKNSSRDERPQYPGTTPQGEHHPPAVLAVFCILCGHSPIAPAREACTERLHGGLLWELLTPTY